MNDDGVEVIRCFTQQREALAAGTFGLAPVTEVYAVVLVVLAVGAIGGVRLRRRREEREPVAAPARLPEPQLPG